VNLVDFVRKDFLGGVTKITEIHHIPVVTATVILADAGTDKPPHQQKENIYVAKSHEMI
jgi:hypothetical protein